jgi:hypothetical protein
MMNGHQTALWNHTSAVMSLIANVNRGKNTKVFVPSDFHPYDQEQKKKKKPVIDKKAGFDLLKQLAGGNIAEVRTKYQQPGGVVSGLEEGQE